MPLSHQRESNLLRGHDRDGVPSARCRLRRTVLAKRVLALVLVCAAGESCAQPSQPKISLEYAVKATYLYKLAPFVNWPPNTFTAADTPFRICVVGEDPFGDYLEKAVSGRSFGTHHFEVRELDAIGPGDDCQIAFIGQSRSQSLGDALDAVRGEPVLTVTDSNAAPDSGSVMQFVMERGKVRFDVNTSEAARNHLTISSKLLNLALAVNSGS